MSVDAEPFAFLGLQRTSNGTHTPAQMAAPDVDPSDPEQNPYVLKLRSMMTAEADLKDLPPPVPLVHGLIDKGSFSILFGPSGTGKTFLCIDLAMCVATGTWWHGMKVETGRVLYVAAESSGDLHPRTQAWRFLANVPGAPADLVFLRTGVNIFDPAQAGALRHIIGADCYDLVILDTLARSAVGADENSNRDAGIVIDQLDKIREATGATILLVHHTGKDQERGLRGATAYYGAADTVIGVLRTDSSAVLVTTDPSKNGKQRARSAEWGLRLWAHPAAGSIGFTRQQPAIASIPTHLLDTLGALNAVEIPGGVSASVWRASSGLADTSFYRHRADLVTLGLVDQLGESRMARYTISKAGSDALRVDIEMAEIHRDVNGSDASIDEADADSQVTVTATYSHETGIVETPIYQEEHPPTPTLPPNPHTPSGSKDFLTPIPHPPYKGGDGGSEWSDGFNPDDYADIEFPDEWSHQ